MSDRMSESRSRRRLWFGSGFYMFLSSASVTDTQLCTALCSQGTALVRIDATCFGESKHISVFFVGFPVSLLFPASLLLCFSAFSCLPPSLLFLCVFDRFPVFLICWLGLSCPRSIETARARTVTSESNSCKSVCAFKPNKGVLSANHKSNSVPKPLFKLNLFSHMPFLQSNIAHSKTALNNPGLSTHPCRTPVKGCCCFFAFQPGFVAFVLLWVRGLCGYVYLSNLI